MNEKEIKKAMRKQGYRFVGNHSAVKICRWTKKSIRGEGECYKSKFYGISTLGCVQMTPWLGCENKCLHCWRAIEFDFNKIIDKKKSDSPKEIIDECIKAQRKLLEGFKILPQTRHKTVSKANMEKWEEAQEPMQFAISLSGEPTVYPHLGELIEELNKRGKTSFVVTNGLYPEKLREMMKRNQLPTQIYVSVNAPNKKLYDKIHRSSEKNAWEKLNETLDVFSELAPQAYAQGGHNLSGRENLQADPEPPSRSRGSRSERKFSSTLKKCTSRKKDFSTRGKIFTKGSTRTVFRINLVKDLNMVEAENYARMIRKANPLFIEIKGFMSVGFARQRIAYEKMPLHEDIIDFSEKIVKELKKLGEDFKILDEKKESRVLVLGKSKRELRIKK